jgi:predicted phage terminase large subunit-like protein
VNRNIAHLLEKAERKSVEWVFIDTPPNNSASVVEAIEAATLVVIPCRPGLLDLGAVQDTIDLARDLRAPYAVVFNAAPPKRHGVEFPALTLAREHFSNLEVPVSLEALQRISKDQTMSSHVAAGQLQQRPTAREGGLFKRVWFDNPARYLPEDLRLVRAWDFASSVMVSNDPDWTVGLLMGRDPMTKMLYVIDVIRKRLTPGEREKCVKSTAIFDGDEVRIRIPQDPGGAGKFEAQYFVKLLQGYTVSTEPERGSKEQRADSFAAQCEQGFVKLFEGPWNRAFVDELCAFPNGAHDDQVDAASAAFRALMRFVSWTALAA